MEEENLEQKPNISEVEKQVEHISTPTGELLRMHSGRLGRILSNLSILGLIFLLAPMISFVFTVVYYAILIIIPVFTIGLVFISEASRGWYLGLWSGGETLLNISSFLTEIWPIIGGVALGLVVLSLVFLLLDKRNLSKGRIAYSIVVGVLIILLIILIATGGVK